MIADAGRALVVTSGRSRGSLAAVRALTRAGWSVGVGSPDDGGMVAASRWCAQRHRVARPRGDGQQFVGDVRRAVREQGYDVVFGGADDWMAALAHYREALPASVAHPGVRTVAAALDKVELTERARRAGLSAPRSEPATAAALAGWAGPVVVKCRTHWQPGQVQQHRIEARSYPDATSAGPRVEAVRAAGLEPVLQERVTGRLGALIGLFSDGRLTGRVQQMTTGLWPTPSGVSSRAQTVPVDEALAAAAERLLTGLGWSGLVELQFLTGDDGVPHLTDLNGRFYGSLALAEAARPGLVDLWGRLVLGEPLSPLPDGRVGVRYAWIAGDLRRSGVERRGGLVADLVDTMRWTARSRHSVWDVRDPGPALYLLSGRLRPAQARLRVLAGRRAPRAGAATTRG